jgi:hypothetical protein
MMSLKEVALFLRAGNSQNTSVRIAGSSPRFELGTSQI